MSPEPNSTETLDETIRVLQPSHWPQPKGYANGISAKGRLVVTGGTIGWDPVTGILPDGFLAQARQCLDNILVILAEAEAEPHHLIRMTWYVVDIETYLANLKGLAEIYRESIGRHFPAMALVQVVRLVESRAELEIEATAVVPE